MNQKLGDTDFPFVNGRRMPVVLYGCSKLRDVNGMNRTGTDTSSHGTVQNTVILLFMFYLAFFFFFFSYFLVLELILGWIMVRFRVRVSRYHELYFRDHDFLCT